MQRIKKIKDSVFLFANFNKKGWLPRFGGVGINTLIMQDCGIAEYLV